MVNLFFQGLNFLVFKFFYFALFNYLLKTCFLDRMKTVFVPAIRVDSAHFDFISLSFGTE